MVKQKQVVTSKKVLGNVPGSSRSPQNSKRGGGGRRDNDAVQNNVAEVSDTDSEICSSSSVQFSIFW